MRNKDYDPDGKDYRDFVEYPRPSNYRITVDWYSLEDQLTHYDERRGKLEMNPDYQRGRVWTQEQQIAYLEFKMKGGYGQNEIYLNVPGLRGEREPKDAELKYPQLVDGLQRVTAVLEFKQNKFPVFGKYYFREMGRMHSELEFFFNVNSLFYRKDVIKWYLAINSTGTPHTKEELDRVRELLKET